ncbi:LCP family protein [Rhizomonospora bruguierae]|uniref:LCP family protein n=1 Tax=Rhizomonospora bruguierae TaxID=1581705 RepID=UPI001BD195CE|nr:LCP family protein [Micromonospora sp. NBRC 107566]
MTWTHRRAILLAATLVAAVAIGGTAVAVAVHRYGVPQEDLLGEAGATPAATTASPTPSPTPPPGARITGPLNILLVGVDTRESVPGWEPHSDSVVVMHVDETLGSAYLTSLPRDLVVDIPAFPKANFPGERTKLTHAMSYGSRVPGDRQHPNTAQGFQLLAKTVSAYTGIKTFNAGAVLTFRGLRTLVDAVDGIDLYVDQRTPSIHLQPNGKGRPPGGDHGYSGPKMVYEKGNRHLVGWQALDFARQRYLPGGDYTRQRHHQQVIAALIRKIFSFDVVANPVKLDAVLHAIKAGFTFDGRGYTVADWAYALRNLRPENLTMVALPGGGVGSGGGYRGERLEPVAKDYFKAVRGDAVAGFVATHPKLVVKR